MEVLLLEIAINIETTDYLAVGNIIHFFELFKT